MNQTSVLIIDADETSRRFLSTMLQNNDFRVYEAKSAIEGLQKISENIPHIISCDTNILDMRAYEFIQSLRQEKKFALTPIVVFSADPDPDEMEQCTKAGGNEYYVKSGKSTNTFIKNITPLLLAMKDAHPEEEMGILSVFLSAKGGTGTSSICANVAMSLSKLMTSSTVALVDMVLPIGSQCLITGCAGDFNLINVSQLDPEELTSAYLRENLIRPKNWHFDLLPGSPDPGTAGDFNVAHAPNIIDALRKAYDYVLVDFGRSFSRISLPIIQQADVAVLVLSNDLSTVTLTKRTLDYLQEQGIRQERLYPMLNRAVGLEGLTKSEAEEILGIEIRTTIPYMHSNLTLANNQNVPFESKFPTDSANFVFKQMAVEISRLGIQTQAG